MKNQRTEPLELVGLASDLAGILAGIMTSVNEKLAEADEDNLIKAQTDILIAQAAAIETGLAALKQELGKAHHKPPPKPTLSRNAVITSLKKM